MLFLVNDAGVPSVGVFVRVPATTEDLEAPTAPVNLSALGGLGQAVLSWTAATDNVAVTQYRVHRSTIAGFTPGDTNLVGTTTTTGFLDTGAAGTYYYRVVARDAAGNNSPASNEAAAAITADTTHQAWPSRRRHRAHRSPAWSASPPRRSTTSAWPAFASNWMAWHSALKTRARRIRCRGIPRPPPRGRIS